MLECSVQQSACVLVKSWLSVSLLGCEDGWGSRGYVMSYLEEAGQHAHMEINGLILQED